MARARRTEPLQAVVRDSDGVVDNVMVCDQATADLFEDMGVFPGMTLHDVTGLFVAVGWTYDAERTPAFRPAPPGQGWTWNDDEERWDAPPPDPEPDPDPTPDPAPDPTPDPAPAPDTPSERAGD